MNTNNWKQVCKVTLPDDVSSAADIAVTNTYSKLTDNPLTGMIYGKDGRAILLTLIALAAVAGGAVYFRRRRKNKA